MADPKHERHAEFREWIGGAFDPEGFDPEGTNRLLAAVPLVEKGKGRGRPR
jgi:hypothetical protein